MSTWLYVADPHNSTQESLDEGVEKLRGIFSSFKDVGIKDRSMIWNSYVVGPS